MTVRELALAMLDEYELGGKYVNLLLNSHRADRLSREERASLTALLYTVTERKLTYDYYICTLAKRSVSDIDPHTLNILRLGACQIISMSSIPDYAAVNETVKMGRSKGERAFINAVLRRIVACKEEGTLPLPERKKNPARYLSVLHSFPLWLTKHFVALLGEDGAERLLCCFNTHEHTDITVNTTRITREEMLERLVERGIDASLSPLSEITVRIKSSCDPRALPGFDDGLFFVQDTASAVSVLALAPKAGERVIDVCACPGGKSFAASVISGGRAEISAYDIHESKLSLIESGRDRLGFKNISIGSADASLPREELFGSFDAVICDCPCSGLGVLSKKSDMRYRDKEGIAALPELQYSILSTSANYAREGGRVMYSTCSLNPEENEALVARFLDTHPDFEPIDFEVGGLSSDGGMLTMWPHIHETDGFFVACLKRRIK